MRAFKDIASKAQYRDLHQKKELDDKTVFFAFERIITDWYGSRGKENIYPEQWKEGILVVRVRSSLWLTELIMHKEGITAAVNAFLGSAYIERIDLKRG